MSDDSDFDLPDCDEDTVVNDVYVRYLPISTPPEQTSCFDDDPESPEEEGLPNDSLSICSYVKPVSRTHSKTLSVATDCSQMFADIIKPFSHDTSPLSSRRGKVLDVKARFYDKAEQVKAKVEMLRRQQEIQLASQCTFKPSTSGKAGSILNFLERTKPKITPPMTQPTEPAFDPALPLSCAYPKGSLRLSTPNMPDVASGSKAADWIPGQNLSETPRIPYPCGASTSNKPTINEQSVKLAKSSQRDKTPVHLRLFQEARNLAIKHKQNAARHSASPITSPLLKRSISPISKRPVYEGLYKDALQRHTRKASFDCTTTTNTRTSLSKHAEAVRERLVSDNSRKLLENKYTREILTAFTTVGQKGNFASIKEAEDILAELKLRSPTEAQRDDSDLFVKLWVLLEGDVTVKVSRLRGFLMVLEGLRDEIEGVEISGKAIRKDFTSMAERRKLALVKAKEGSESSRSIVFKPTLNKTSVFLSKRNTRRRHESMPNATLFEILHREVKTEGSRKNAIEDSRDADLTEAFTFKPDPSFTTTQIGEDGGLES